MTLLIILIIWLALLKYKPTFEHIKESNILIMYYNKKQGNITIRKRVILWMK